MRRGLTSACILAILAGTSDCLEVTPANPIPVYSLVRVKLAEGERAWVLGADLLPVDVAKTAFGLVFTGGPGRYAVLAFSETSQDQAIVEIGGSGPGPGPDPDPDPDPQPGPDNPPDDLLNKYGLGLVAWREALRLGVPAEARKLSQAFINAAGSLDRHQLTTAQAQSYVRTVRLEQSGDWEPWAAKVELALNAAADKHGIGILWYRNYFYEIGKALEAASQ